MNKLQQKNSKSFKFNVRKLFLKIYIYRLSNNPLVTICRNHRFLSNTNSCRRFCNEITTNHSFNVRVLWFSRLHLFCFNTRKPFQLGKNRYPTFKSIATLHTQQFIQLRPLVIWLDYFNVSLNVRCIAASCCFLKQI